MTPVLLVLLALSCGSLAAPAPPLGRQGIFGPMSPEQIERLLSDRAYVQKQLGCVLGRNPCDQIGNQLRVAIPEVLLRQCRSCNAHQQENARTVINYIQKHYPEEWAQIQAKYKGKRQY